MLEVPSVNAAGNYGSGARGPAGGAPGVVWCSRFRWL